jgi:hypothetical protein
MVDSSLVNDSVVKQLVALGSAFRHGRQAQSPAVGRGPNQSRFFEAFALIRG